MAGFFSKLRGTFSSIFQLGKTGPNLKANGSVIEHRDNTDAAFVIARALDPVAANDLVTLQYLRANNRLSMTIGGNLSTPTLPSVNLGVEIENQATTLTILQGRRGVPGTSGTSTIQLEINGAAIGGASLSWASTDAAFTFKSVAISQAVAVGDYVSFRLTAAEANGEDIFLEVN